MPSAETTRVSVDEPEPVRPTKEDEVASTGSELIGGPIGRRALLGTSWWTPVRVVALVAIGMFALGMVQKLPCYDGAWFFGASSQYTHACYSDIPHLYQGRGFADGLVPYFDKIPGDMEYLEYPVLTGVFMEVAAWLTPGSGTIQEQEQWYWMVNAGMLMACAAVIAVCCARIHRRRPWDGLLVALAPAFALTATINWDLLAVALLAAAMLMWSRGRPLAFGVLIGLATAAKFYPFLVLGPLFVLCWRAGKWRAFVTALLGTVGAWLAVNIPVMLLAPDGWAKFYRFSQERGVDFGSFFLVVAQRMNIQITAETANAYAMVSMVLVCAGIVVLTLTAPRRPRFAQLAFLIVAAFILTNKVYSPQYVLWLVPSPRWPGPAGGTSSSGRRAKWRTSWGSGCTSRTRPAGTPTRVCLLRATNSPSWRICWGRCTCASSSCGTSSCPSATRCAGRAMTIPPVECSTARRTFMCTARRPIPAARDALRRDTGGVGKS